MKQISECIKKNMKELKKYMPSNGSEGMWFTEKFCENCTRQSIDPDAKTQCIHAARAWAGDDNGKWVYDETGNPTCTAFRDRKNRKKYVKKSKKDEKQLELF